MSSNHPFHPVRSRPIPGQRHFRWLAGVLLLSGLCHETGATPLVSTTGPVAPLVTGEAAWQQLKNEGQYDSLAAAMTGARYSAQVADGAGTRAWNPAHGLRSTFTPEGLRFEVQAGSAVHQVGWRLASLGYGATQTTVSAGEVVARGQRVEVRRDALGLTEWYHNTPGGLEHGFTLAARPAANPRHEPLSLVLAVTGGLTPRADATGQNLQLRDVAGQTVLAYEKLKVWDAAGAILPATLHAAGGLVTITVQDAGALYPLTIDPTFTQQAYLKASNTAGEDRFGISVAISGDTVVIGADGEDDDATGVNGDQSHNSNTATFAGAAYVFTRTGMTWTQQAYLKASNTEAVDAFGFAVAIAGDTIVVGAYGEDSNATGVDGNQSDNSVPYAGAAYVFTRTGTNWAQQAYLKASNAGGDRFGLKVAVSGDTVVVAAPDEDSSATGVNGNQTDNGTSNAGAAYIFTRNGTTWSQQAYLKASNPGLFDSFGSSVAVSGNTVVVGARNEASSATGVNHPTGQASNSALSAGAAYVFTRAGTTWSQQAYLKASNTGSADEFGESVAIAGDTIVIGARGEDSNATGVNGEEGNNSGTESGAAYIFTRAGTTWTQQAYLKASNSGGFDYFGKSVAVSGDTVVVGAYGEASNAVGANPPAGQSDNSSPRAGAVYVFTRAGTTWTQQSYLKAGNTDATPPFSSLEPDAFGYSVSVSGDTVLVGAYGEDSSARGVNGDSSDNNAREAGAAYLFGPPITITLPKDLTVVTNLPAIHIAGAGFVGNPNLYIIRLADGAFWTELGWASRKSSAILPTAHNFADQTWVSSGSLPRIGGKHKNTAMADGDYNLIALAYDGLGQELRANAVIKVKYTPAFTFSGFSSTPTTGALIRTGNPWRFTAVLASTISDLRVRVQSTLTPNQEASWTYVAGGAPMSRLDSNWTLNTADVPAGKLYFRAIASAPGYADETSTYLGPLTVEGFAAFGDFSLNANRPWSTGTPWTFTIVQTSLFSDQRLRVQSTTDRLTESSWTDLPGGGQMTHVGSLWKLVTSDVPLGTRYFRVIASAPGYADLASDNVFGPLTVEPLRERVVENKPSGTYSLQGLAGVQNPWEVYIQAIAQASVFIVTDLGQFAHLIAQAAITLVADLAAEARLTIGADQALTAPAVSIGRNTTFVLPGTCNCDVRLIGLDGASLIGNDSGTLIGFDAASLTGIRASGSLVASDGASLVATDGASVISHDSSSIVSHDSGSLIGNDGGTLQALNPAMNGKLTRQSVQAAATPAFTGVMTVNGNYTQEAGTGLAIAIAGMNTASTGAQEYDQLAVSGRADLAGVIGFGLFNPADQTLATGLFQPVVGATFDVVVASTIVTHNLIVRGPVWGDGLGFRWSVVQREDGKQALRLVAVRLAPMMVIRPGATLWEIAYPTNFTGFSLQRSASLTNPNWTLFSTGTNRVTIDRTNAAGFYRMFKP